jgi:hypothetical protein
LDENSGRGAVAMENNTQDWLIDAESRYNWGDIWVWP